MVMKKQTSVKSNHLLLLLISFFWLVLAQAQESVNASGGNATGSGGTVSYSVGQVIYTTNTGSTGTVAQGVQHAYEIYSIGIKETTLDISLSIYPNPTANNITLQISNYSSENINYQLNDMQGKLLSSRQITTQQTQIDISNLPPATYFVHIINEENKRIQSFKIIKTTS